MARVHLIATPADIPADSGEDSRAATLAMFETLFPGADQPGFDANHAGMAIAAHNPALALALARVSGVVAGQLGWCQRRDLRELAIQTLNLHFGGGYAYESRLPYCTAAGVTAQMLADLSDWQHSPSFDVEQRLTIEYTRAVVATAVSDELFDRVKAVFGEKGAVECTALIGLWSMWAMLLGATRPSL